MLICVFAKAKDSQLPDHQNIQSSTEKKSYVKYKHRSFWRSHVEITNVSRSPVKIIQFLSLTKSDVYLHTLVLSKCKQISKFAEFQYPAALVFQARKLLWHGKTDYQLQCFFSGKVEILMIIIQHFSKNREKYKYVWNQGSCYFACQATKCSFLLLLF